MFINIYNQFNIIKNYKNFWKKIKKQKSYIIKFNKNNIIKLSKIQRRTWSRKGQIFVKNLAKEGLCRLSTFERNLIIKNLYFGQNNFRIESRIKLRFFYFYFSY